MTYIKKLVVHGFKSFVRKTSLDFTQGINVILGPNGSGKSNVSDALCFVLGRLSAKSMRAAKSKNLIFLGSKVASPAKEASVEIIFDNSDKTFSIDRNEISIKRIVRRNGQSIYKINNETKTRQNILTLLAQTGIDPNGFNIILQGEIQNFVRMHTDERRKIIEEVSGISIYESRKQKSLRELGKTEEKLKEVLAILRERTAYLNNLEKERQQALKFKKLEKDVKKFKASIIYFELQKRKKQEEELFSEISKKENSILKIKQKILQTQMSIANLEDKIKSINLTIQNATGFEQEKINKDIADLRAEIAGLNVRQENYENKLSSMSKQIQELKQLISEYQLSVKELQKESSHGVGKEKDLDKKKKELEELEKERKKFYSVKSELKSFKERYQDKLNLLKNFENESEILLRQIENHVKELFDKKTSSEKLNELKTNLKEKNITLENLRKKQSELEKSIYVFEQEIKKLEKLKTDIIKLDVCPLCKNKITKEHIQQINKETNPKIKESENKIRSYEKDLSSIKNKITSLTQKIKDLSLEISKRETDLIKLSSILEKKQRIKFLQENIDETKKQISEFEKKKKKLEDYVIQNLTIEQKYETVKIEVQEITLRSQENIDSEVSFKQRELERSQISLKQFLRESLELEEELEELKKELIEKENLLHENIEQEEELSKKFKRLIAERDYLQDKIRENESEILKKQNEIYQIEQEINELKINKARVDAEYENYETEMLDFSNVEIIKANKDSLSLRLEKTQEILSRIGSVNLRSLEVYDSVKQEYDAVKQRVEIVEKEKNSILKIIHEIDVKKKKTFMQTLNSLNEIFSRNFSQLSVKGQVFLELENRKDPFEGGVGIIVKTGHGKYFDVTSLSGGEQTLVALALIFAIQEHKPYCFYILDEIDAALDKRNSERLANLLKKYMQKGQYIIITHNDEIITKATNLYGVSMHDGVSKIISLRV